MIDRNEHPALHMLLESNRADFDGKPFECCDCPLGRPLGKAEGFEPPNWADPGEGHYDCLLLGGEEVARRNDNASCWTYRESTVWGEAPLCKPEEWRARAVEELRGLIAKAEGKIAPTRNFYPALSA